MKIMLVNGSPRKDWNTATLLKHAQKGAASQGAVTELIHLYDLTYKGCISCFACKEKNGKSFGRCAVQDALTPLFKRIKEADAIILGSPIYLATVTGAMQSFMERLFFPYLQYSDPPSSLFPKKIQAGFIFTMGIPEKAVAEFGYDRRFASIDRLLQIIFGASTMMFSYDTYQFDDYSKVVAPRFDPVDKLRRRTEIFPHDCQQAYDMGVRFAEH